MKSAIWTRIVRVASDTLYVDPTELTPESSVETTPGWSSLAHLRLLTAVEREFGIRFAGSELPTLVSLERIECAVGSRLP